jgi:aminobenzoyl-glutamate utilization protein B
MIHAVTRLARSAIALLALGLLPVPAAAQPAPTDSWLDQTRTHWVAVAQKIWETPELALEEKKSSAALAAELEKEGFRVTWGSGGEATAFVATSGEGSPVVALLAEYDALPGLSQAAAKPKKEALAENGPGHGCGHNLLGTAAVAAAIAANRARVEQKLPGTIQLFGTPAEEQLYGKTFMVRDDAFRDTDLVLSWHPDDQNRVSNRTRLAATAVDVEFFGRSSHAAASPWLGRSSLDALVLFDHAMALMREHIKPTARIHRMISKGGVAANIIPDYAKGQYWLRDSTGDSVNEMLGRLRKAADGAALGTETRAQVTLLFSVREPVANNTSATRRRWWPRRFSPPRRWIC